jgi:hypothetical protein
MVTGMDIFRRHFAGLEEAYAIIGGAACEEWFTQAGGRFRATKDIDMVLVLEARQPAFFPRFWAFIHEGRYQPGQRADGTRTFFRFLKPMTPGFPAMIELLAPAAADFQIPPGQVIIPIPLEDAISSLSAILLDPAYYAFIMTQRDVIEGLPLIKPAGLIVLKARAYLDLSSRRTAGDKTVLEQDINKHRADVFRLASLLPTGESLALEFPIMDDIRAFLEAFPVSAPAWPAISQSLGQSGIRMAPAALIDTLKTYFQVPA